MMAVGCGLHQVRKWNVPDAQGVAIVYFVDRVKVAITDYSDYADC